MTVDRYALIGLGRARSSWLTEVSLWANAGAIPVELSKCVSIAEVRQKLQDLRRYSAVLVEGSVSGVDRDLIARADRHGLPVIIVDGSADAADKWIPLGAAAILPPSFAPGELLSTLSTHSSAVGSNVDVTELVLTNDVETPSGRLIAVCGSGGTGTSTVSMALAQGLASDALNAELVLLADLARNGEQAMLHDAGDVMPGIEELVEANRSRTVDIDDIRSLTFRVPTRSYHLLLGQRRRGSWSALSPRAIEASLVSMRRAYQYVVADITADFEGETDGGSMDVEERNGLSRCATLQADLVVVVGMTGVKGTHSLGRVVRELIQTGVEPARLLPVFNRVPRRFSRRETIGALAVITGDPNHDTLVNEPIFLPDKEIEAALRDVAALPESIVAPLLLTTTHLLIGTRAVGPFEHTAPASVKPGTFGMRPA